MCHTVTIICAGAQGNVAASHSESSMFLISDRDPRVSTVDYTPEVTLGPETQASKYPFTVHFKNKLIYATGFPGSSDSKGSACDAGDQGLIPGLGSSPGEVHGNPLQYSCLVNPHGQRSLGDYSP